MKLLIQRFRSLLQDWSCAAMNGIEYHIIAPADYPSLRISFGWWLDGLCGRIFGLAYSGSEEELDAVRNGEVPREYMTRRQREFGYESVLSGCLFDELICVDCGVEALLVSDETNLCANCRALHPEMLLEFNHPTLATS